MIKVQEVAGDQDLFQILLLASTYHLLKMAKEHASEMF